MIYLDNSATSRYKPLCVKLACINELYHSANAGRSSHKASMRAALKIEDTRSTICKYFFDGNVVFTKNCTEALNLAIFGSNLSGQVITTIYEHNSVLRPLKYLEKTGKITLKIITLDKNDLMNSLNNALNTPTSMVAISAMSNVNGYALPVEKMAKLIKEKSKAIILVDMAQAAGHIKLDYSNIDIIATSAHKSLHGIQGSGFLLAKNFIPLTPLILGGTGISGLSLDPPVIIPDSLEAGTANTIGISCLQKGITWTMKHYNKLHSKCLKLESFLIDGLREIPKVKIYGYGNGIALFNIENQPSSDIGDILSQDYGICVRSGLHCAPLMHMHLGTKNTGAIRVSIGANNSNRDIEKLLDAVKEIADNICVQNK
ncbi:MAG TPA: aminotransferase class V-fold PLP-dependent enzyme [Clostridia bacterium]|nr:aminotransferase class V-fold PLP-dependent enzyme [Clostridia bacterium]